MQKIKYDIHEENNVMDMIFTKEGGKDKLISVPDHVECSHCGKVFCPSPLTEGFEEEIYVYSL